MTRKPAALGTVWAATARIRIITEDFKWETLHRCLDTPVAVDDAVAAVIIRTGIPKSRLWIHGDASGNRMVL